MARWGVASRAALCAASLGLAGCSIPHSGDPTLDVGSRTLEDAFAPSPALDAAADVDVEPTPSSDTQDAALDPDDAVVLDAGPSPTPDATTGPAPDLLEWVEVPGGTFTRGHPDEPRAQPQREVTVRPFLITRSEVTETQYEACVAARVCSTTVRDLNRCHGIDGYGPQEPALRAPLRPAVCVTWAEARLFASWASGRLPTEAEWEYAARRGRENQPYPWGDRPPSCDLTVMSQGVPGCGENATSPVCSREADDSIDGLCDVVGNVREWVDDFYRPDYDLAPADGGPNNFPDETFSRSVRGASWRNGQSFRFTLYHRSPADPKEGYDFIGFRVVRDQEE